MIASSDTVEDSASSICMFFLLNPIGIGSPFNYDKPFSVRNIGNASTSDMSLLVSLLASIGANVSI